jgi:hypothetical protein
VILGGVGMSYERGTPVPDTAQHSAKCLTGTNRGGRNSCLFQTGVPRPQETLLMRSNVLRGGSSDERATGRFSGNRLFFSRFLMNTTTHQFSCFSAFLTFYERSTCAPCQPLLRAFPGRIRSPSSSGVLRRWSLEEYSRW